MNSSRKFILALAVLVTLVGSALSVYLLMKPKTNPLSQPRQNQSITVNGNVVCLPHKVKDGPQTLECATGLQNEAGQFYGLKGMPSRYASTGQAVTVTGVFLEAEPSSLYDTSGTIEVKEVKDR